MENNKIVIFGGGIGGQRILKLLDEDDVIAVVDNDEKKRGTIVGDFAVQSPEVLNTLIFDKIVIATAMGLAPVTEQLLKMGISRNKIITEYVTFPVKSRLFYLEKLAEIIDKNILGSVAEAGVYQGEFAKEINRIFPNRKLYLFDTFEGFPSEDANYDNQNNFSQAIAQNYGNTNIDTVLSKMLYVENVIIKKGWFPQSAKDVNDIFVFVNLDMDLFMPTKAALNFFFPRMVKGGVILVHDYFEDQYRGVKQAVDEFKSANDNNVIIAPIGDGISIALHKC